MHREKEQRHLLAPLLPFVPGHAAIAGVRMLLLVVAVPVAPSPMAVAEEVVEGAEAQAPLLVAAEAQAPW